MVNELNTIEDPPKPEMGCPLGKAPTSPQRLSLGRLCTGWGSRFVVNTSMIMWEHISLCMKKLGSIWEYHWVSLKMAARLTLHWIKEIIPRSSEAAKHVGGSKSGTSHFRDQLSTRSFHGSNGCGIPSIWGWSCQSSRGGLVGVDWTWSSLIHW